jgi:hypothetical protein
MRKTATALLATLATVPALEAHHAPAVFDQSRTIVVEGMVTEFVWANPHSWIRMDVTAEDGTVRNWSMEMNPPTYLVRGGWRSTTIKPGDKVSVVANPLRTSEPGGKYVAITLPDGSVLGEQAAVLGEE